MALRHSQLPQGAQQKAGLAAAYVTADADQLPLRRPEMNVAENLDIFGLLRWLVEVL